MDALLRHCQTKGADQQRRASYDHRATSRLHPEEFEELKYSQELARNVWVAFVVLLEVITQIKWGGGEQLSRKGPM